MFSTSMMASSTTSPSAIASPPNVRVLMPKPRYSSARMAASSESGMAVREMAAARASARKSSSTTATSTAPSSSDVVMLRSARSMNSDGRNKAGCSSRPADSIAGRRRARAASTRAATTLVLAPELAGDDDHEAALAVDASLAEAGLRRFRHPAEIAEAEHQALSLPHHGCGDVCGVDACPSERTVSRWLGWSITPPPRSPLERRAASVISAIPTP